MTTLLRPNKQGTERAGLHIYERKLICLSLRSCQSVLQHFVLPKSHSFLLRKAVVSGGWTWAGQPFQLLPCSSFSHPAPALGADPPSGTLQDALNGCIPWHRVQSDLPVTLRNSYFQQQPSIQHHLANQVEKSRLKTPKNQVEFVWMCCECSPWYWALNPFCLWLPSDVKWSLSQFLLLITGAGRFIPVNLQETNQEQPSVILTVSYSKNQTSLHSWSSLVSMRDVSC